MSNYFAKYSIEEIMRWEKQKKYFVNNEYEETSNSVSLMKKKRVAHNTKGIMGLFCPICKEISFIEILAKSNMSIWFWDPELDTDASTISCDFVPLIPCPNCGFDMIDIDPNIVEAISILNRKGYVTKYCCESHEGTAKTGKSDAYIYFKYFNQMMYAIGFDVPFGWFLDMDEYNHHKYIIRAEYNESKDYLYELLEFARGLPEYCGPELKESNDAYLTFKAR